MAEQESQSQSAPALEGAPAAPAPSAAAKPRRRLRGILLLLGPIVALTVGAYVYYTSGRVVGTDNAYVKSDVGAISAEVAGPIAALNVHENDRVEAGAVLFTIDDRAFLPEGRILDIRFHEYMADQPEAVVRVLEFAGHPFTSEARANVARFLAANPRGKHGLIDYRLADVWLDADERRRALRFYQERFGVPDES